MELPPWLPNDMIDIMLRSFSQKLCMELDLFTSGTNALSLQCNILLMSDNAVNKLKYFPRVRPFEKRKIKQSAPYAQRERLSLPRRTVMASQTVQ